MSLAVSTSPARPPSAAPTWLPNIAPPALPSIPISGPAIALASSGIALPMAPTTCSATGSTRTRQTSVVCSIHSARLQAAVVVTPEGSTVASSSQWSASRIASATAVWSLRSGLGSGSWAEVRRAMSVARVQFTGPSYGASWPASGPSAPRGRASPAALPAWPPDPPSALKICSKGVPLNGLSSGPLGLLLMGPNYRSPPMSGPGPASYARAMTSASTARRSRRGPPARPARDRRSIRPRCWPPWTDPAAGGVNLFVGAVRDHDDGEQVDHLDYTAHPSALDRLREVAEGVAEEFEVIALAAVHRTGHLEIGDIAVAGRRVGRPPRPGVRRLARPDRPAQGHRARLEAPGLRGRPRGVGQLAREPRASRST